MPSYAYKAKNSHSQTVSGHIQAQHQEEALELIYQQGLVPVTIEEETSHGVLISSIETKKVKNKEIFMFTKQLAGLVKSSVSLLKGLDVIAGQNRNPYFSKVISEIAQGVRTGRSFSNCLAQYPAIFSNVYVAMIRVGEEMGHLREVLNDLAQYYKRQDELSSKVSGAIVYPLVMLVVGTLTVVFILTFVLPKIAVIFADAHEKLPTPTLIVMMISQFVLTFWLPIVIGFSVFILAFNRWRQSNAGKVVIGAWLLRIFIIKDLVVKVNLTRFSRTTFLLLQSGLPLVRSIETAAQTIGNPQLKMDMLVTAEVLNGGENFGQSLKRCVHVPWIFIETLTVAEEGGHLKEAFADIADACESDVQDALKTITTLLEPMMILIVGAVVGFIIFAMLLPIFSMDIMAR